MSEVNSNNVQTQSTVDVYKAYETWPADIRKKLSMHDLRRMSGWVNAEAMTDIELEAILSERRLRRLEKAQ